MIASAAVQEDVSVVCVSILSGAHQRVFPELLRLLKEKGGEDIPVLGGGIIPDRDIPELKKIGVKEVFTSGASLSDITDFIRNLVAPQS